MKNILITLFFLSISVAAFAQIKVVASGKVGLNEPNPQKRLHINSSTDNVAALLESTDTRVVFQMQDNGTTKPPSFGATNDDFDFNSDGDIRFNNFTANQTKMTLSPSGNLGVGSTTPNYRLDIQDTNPDIARFYNPTGNAEFLVASANGSESKIQFVDANSWIAEITASDAGDLAFKAQDAGGEPSLITSTRMTIRGNGNVGVGITSPSFLFHVNGTAAKPGGGMWTDAASDKRLKKNIKKYGDGLKTILQLNPVEYQFNSRLKDYDNGETYIGFIAQEVKEVAPYMVSEFSVREFMDSGIETEDLEDRDATVIGEQEFLTVDNSAVVFMLINAVKEQQAIIEEKEDQLNLLLHRIENIEKQISNTTINLDIETVDVEDPLKVFITDIVLKDVQVPVLDQNSPNPFDGQTKVRYYLPSEFDRAEIVFFDMNGSLIKSLPIEHSGVGELNISADEIPSGTYNYSLIVDGNTIDTKQMVLSK